MPGDCGTIWGEIPSKKAKDSRDIHFKVKYMHISYVSTALTLRKKHIRSAVEYGMPNLKSISEKNNLMHLFEVAFLNRGLFTTQAGP